jgi:hypothetical protein
VSFKIPTEDKFFSQSFLLFKGTLASVFKDKNIKKSQNGSNQGFPKCVSSVRDPWILTLDKWSGFCSFRQWLSSRVGKNPGFFKKTQPSGFFWVFWVFWGFFGFFGFFWVFLPRQEGF